MGIISLASEKGKLGNDIGLENLEPTKRVVTARGEQMKFEPIKTDATTKNRIKHYGIIYYKPESENQQPDANEKHYFSEWKNHLTEFWKNDSDSKWKKRMKNLKIEAYRSEVNRIFRNYGKLEYDPIVKKIFENDPILKEIFERDADMQFIEELRKNYRKTKDMPMSVVSASLKKEEEEINSLINELGSLPKKLDLLTEEKRETLDLESKKILDSLAKEKRDSVIKKMNLWTTGRYILMEKKLLKKKEREKLDLWSKKPDSLTKEELDSLILKLKPLMLKRNSWRKKGLNSLMGKRNSWEKKLDSWTKNLDSLILKKLNSLQKKQKIKINPKIKNIQMEEKC